MFNHPQGILQMLWKDERTWWSCYCLFHDSMIMRTKRAGRYEWQFFFRFEKLVLVDKNISTQCPDGPGGQLVFADVCTSCYYGSFVDFSRTLNCHCLRLATVFCFRFTTEDHWSAFQFIQTANVAPWNVEKGELAAHLSQSQSFSSSQCFRIRW